MIERWQGNKFAGLYLYGRPGTGKTHAAIGLARALHDEAGADIFYRYIPSLGSSGEDKSSNWSGKRYELVKKAVPSSIFPSTYRPGIDRNPKTVAVLDDYKPDMQKHVAAGVEAAAQFGGLVIITSNYTDPFKLLEQPTAAPATVNEAIGKELLERENEEAFAALQRRQAQAAEEISASLRSRMVAGIKLIEFSGPDRRIEQSFWG